jgi:hypothetical protein
MGTGEGIMTRADNFTPPGTDPGRWAKLKRLEKKSKKSKNKKHNTSSTSTKQSSDEQKFEPLFTVAINEIDRLNSEATQKKDSIETELENNKKNIVLKLADDLKAQGLRVDRIANEIIHQLKGRASDTWIREILPDEYKDKKKQENAKKRWNRNFAPAPVQNQQTTDVAEQPVEQQTTDEIAQTQTKRIIVGIDGSEIIDKDPSSEASKESNSKDLPPKAQDIPTIKIPEYSVKESPQPQPQPQQQQQQQPQQHHLRILVDWDELSDKMAELHRKDIKNFWLCGRIEDDKLLDMALEREVQ